MHYRMLSIIPGLSPLVANGTRLPEWCQSQMTLGIVKYLLGGQHGPPWKTLHYRSSLFSEFVTPFWMFDIVEQAAAMNWNSIVVP